MVGDGTYVNITNFFYLRHRSSLGALIPGSDSKKFLLRKWISRQSIFRYTLIYFPWLFLVKLLLLWVILHLFPVFIHKNRRKYMFLIRVTVWFRFRTGRHLLQNEYMHYDCLGKKIIGYDDKLYRFTGTFFFLHVCPRLLHRVRR